MKKLFSLISVVMLVGCGSSVNIKTQPVVLPPPPAPVAQPIVTNPVIWKIITKDDLPALEALIKKSPNGNFVFYTLDNQNFQNLATNLEDIKRYLLDQQQIILYYQKLNTPTTPDTSKK